MRPNQSESGPTEFGSYFSDRKKKLRKQDEENNEEDKVEGEFDSARNGSGKSSKLFEGMTMHINGYTGSMDHLSLKNLILKHGAKYDHYFSRSSTTHMIASVLTEAKKKAFRNLKVVSPQWIFDCIQHQRILPWELYSSLESNIRTDNPDYLTHYFHRSRLHHLSMWKTELQAFVEGLQGTLTLKVKGPTNVQIVCHVDMDCFFASVALIDRPDLVNMPVGVSHGTSEQSTADIASCNYIARQFGVKNGMMANQALALCPNLVLLPYTFDKYKIVSEQLYRLLAEHADDLEAVSCDEAYIKLYLKNISEAEDYVGKLREKIFSVTRCAASVGIGENKLLARLATIKAKPNGVYHLTRSTLLTLLHEFKVTQLPGVGPAIARKLELKQVTDCHGLFLLSKPTLQREFGNKTGETLYQMCRGIDSRDFGHKLRKSISVEVNYGIRFSSHEECHNFLRNLANEVSERLRTQRFLTRMLTLKVMKRASEAEPRKYLGHGICDTFSKSAHLNHATQTPGVIFDTLVTLIEALDVLPEDLRGLGVTCTLLVPVNQHSVSDLLLQSANRAPSHLHSKSSLAPPYKREDIDKSVLKSLPIQIQQELNDAFQLTQSIPSSKKYPNNALDLQKRTISKGGKRQKEKEKKDRASPLSSTLRNQGKRLKHSLSEELSGLPCPSLLGHTSLDEIRPLLRQWLEFTASQIDITDTEADLAILQTYLDSLIEAKKLNDLVLILRYVLFVAKQLDLVNLVETVLEKVSSEIQLKYNCRLHI